MPDLILWGYAAMIGAVIGSFLNVCIHRWPLGQSVVSPRSRCTTCARAIAWHENIPVVSYLLLRGRCRGCRERISIQYPLVEIATAAIWLVAAVRFGPSLEAFRSAAFLTMLLGIALTDARHMVIPDQLSLGGAVLGIALAAAPGGYPLQKALVGAVLGYALLRGMAWGGEKLFRKPALGLGDVHMMAMVGAFTGIVGVLLSILLGSVLGLVLGVPFSWWRGKLTLLGTYLPLGTFLAMAAALAHIWGDRMVAWYLAYALGGA